MLLLPQKRNTWNLVYSVDEIQFFCNVVGIETVSCDGLLAVKLDIEAEK